MTANLLSPFAERSLFWDLRRIVSRTLLRQAFQQARLRSTVILVLSLLFWIAMFGMFFEGFSLLNSMITHVGSRAQTVHAIFNVFFATLLVMLTVSSSIIFYSSLYNSREAVFLLTTPTRPKRIVWHKFQESLVFSGWGFVLMGSPLLVAYGVTSGALWYYFVMLVPFVVAFVAIPVSCGALICMCVVRYLPTLRMYAAGFVLAAGLILAILAGWSIVNISSRVDQMTPQWLHETISRMEFTEQRFLPSWWLCSGLLEAAHPDDVAGRRSWIESLGFLSALLSTALVLYGIVGWCGAKMFVRGFTELPGLLPQRRLSSLVWLDWCVERALCLFPTRMRLLLVKDVKVFRRDPLQWLQVSVFLALMVFYFLQLRRLYFQEALAKWIVMASFLNVAVVGLLLATFTTRFIYPLISLEGRRIWILATLPIRREWILWSKFLFGCLVSVPPCCALVLLSDYMLQTTQYSMSIVLLHQVTALALCTGLSGIAVGLGARFPNLRENSPAKIAAGFGGTLTLVLSSVLILLAVGGTAVPTFLWMQSHSVNMENVRQGTHEIMTFTNNLGLFCGLLLVVLCGLAATIIPMWSGMRPFRKLEV